MSFSCVAIVLAQNSSSLAKPDTGKEDNNISTDLLRSLRKAGKDLGTKLH